MLKRIFVMVLFLVWFTPAPGSEAHSPIEKRMPNVNEVLYSAPEKIDLYFKDPVQIHRSSVVVREQNQIEVQVGKPKLDPKDARHVFVDLQKGLASGSYSVEIDVVSLDGHFIREKYLFEIKISITPSEETFQRLRLERSLPEDGTILQTAPQTIELWYNEPVELEFGLLNDRQQLVTTEQPVADSSNPGRYTVKLKDELRAGTYTILSYPKIGDQTRLDTLYFAVKQVTPVTGVNQYSDETLRTHIGLLQFTHWTAYLSLLSLFGGVWFQRFVAKNRGDLDRWKRIANFMYGIGAAAVLIEIFLNKRYYSEAAWIDFLQFNFVWLTLLQVCLVVLSWLFKRLRIYLLFLSVIGFAMVGHSVDPSYGGIWAVGFDIIHLLAASIWMGGLMGLLVMMPKDGRADWLTETVKSFSRWALASFVFAGASGVFMTISYVPVFSFKSLLMSFWGQMLLFKVILFSIVVWIGFWQRKLLVRLAGKWPGVFKRNLKAELIIAAILLLAAGILVDLSPKEAASGFSPKQQTVNGITAKIEVKPWCQGAMILPFI